MLEAGIPPCFWKYAIRCVSHLLNIEPNDEEVSAWCKLHGEEFKGKMIPFGALVFFKPSGARAVEQKHKFDPKGIPGVFAGYELGPGLHWSRKYRVWALTDWSKQSLAYNAGKPIPKLKTPHYTERVELREPLEFPCKENYEKINVTIEGLKEKDRLEGSPDYLPLPPPGTGDDNDDDDDQDDDNAGDDDKGDGGGDGPDGGSKSGVDPSIMAEVEELEFMGAEDAARRADLPPPPGLEQPAPDSSSKPDRVIVPESLIEHYLEGTKGDNIVYLNDDGERVKIDKIGRLYRVDERGYKIVRDSPRPAKYTPTEWQKVPHETRKEIIRVQEMEADVARERSKMERKIKDAEKTSKTKEKKKKEREAKKKSSSSRSKKKEKGPDHDIGVSVEHEYSRPGKIFVIGKRSTSDDECDGKCKMSSTIAPFGCRSNALVSTSDMSDTDVPDDDDFLVEWDEWSEVEKGFGPKATWSNEKSYDFTNGKVVASAP
eukprot:s7878_g1.t1